MCFEFLVLPARSGTMSLRHLLKIPAVIVVSLGVIMSAMVWSILDPTLSVFLAIEVGLQFLLFAGSLLFIWFAEYNC